MSSCLFKNSTPRVLQKVLLQLPSSVSIAPFWCSNNTQVKQHPKGCYKKRYCNSPLVFPLHLCGVVTTPKLNSTSGCCKKCYCNSPLVFPLHPFGVVTTPKLNSTPRVLQKVLLLLPSSVSTAPFGVITTPKVLPSILMALFNRKNIDIGICNKIISLSIYSHFY